MSVEKSVGTPGKRNAFIPMWRSQGAHEFLGNTNPNKSRLEIAKNVYVPKYSSLHIYGTPRTALLLAASKTKALSCGWFQQCFSGDN